MASEALGRSQEKGTEKEENTVSQSPGHTPCPQPLGALWIWPAWEAARQSPGEAPPVPPGAARDARLVLGARLAPLLSSGGSLSRSPILSNLGFCMCKTVCCEG